MGDHLVILSEPVMRPFFPPFFLGGRGAGGKERGMKKGKGEEEIYISYI